MFVLIRADRNQFIIINWAVILRALLVKVLRVRVHWSTQMLIYEVYCLKECSFLLRFSSSVMRLPKGRWSLGGCRLLFSIFMFDVHRDGVIIQVFELISQLKFNLQFWFDSHWQLIFIVFLFWRPEYSFKSLAIIDLNFCERRYWNKITVYGNLWPCF